MAAMDSEERKPEEVVVKKSSRALFKILICLAVVGVLAAGLAAQVATDPTRLAPEILTQAAANIIAAEIPREYERTKDWGKTKAISTGLRSSGNFFDFDIHRKKKQVKHGIWKAYKLNLIDPDKNLDVKVENLRTLEGGRVALTLNMNAKVHGWARTKMYELGVHIISLEIEGDTDVRLSIDTEIGMHSVKTDSYLPSYAVDPKVTAARMNFDDFRVTRVSDVRGSAAHELGILLREAVEVELAGNKLADKINKAIDKKRDKLILSPDTLFKKVSAKTTADEAVTR
jgi:hypothetical protein